MSVTLRFDVSVRVKLDSPRETDPFVDVYLTSDVRSPSASGVSVVGQAVGSRIPREDPEVISSERYQDRMVGQKRTPSVGGKSAKNLVVSSVRCPVSLVVRKTSGIAGDAAVCIHVFCEVECDDDVWGSHTCGWCGVTLRGLSEIATRGERSVSIQLRDPGSSPEGSRGSVELSFEEETAEALRRKISFAAPDEKDYVSSKPSVLAEAVEKYDSDVAAGFSKALRDTTSIDIRMTRLPMYSTCGGSISRPPCAFVMSRKMLEFDEEFYLRALDCVLRRRMRVKPSEFADESNRTLTPDERGAVLMDVAMFFPTACVYLFDEVLSRDGTHLVAGEEFSRLASTTFCVDCEDLSFFAVMVLNDLASDRKWNSEPVRMLHRLRMQYVATIALKAVARVSVVGLGGSQGKGLAAHDCCDLVPVVRMADMIAASGSDPGSLAEIVRERSIDASANRVLSVVVGEGTGRVIEFAREENPAHSPTAAKRIAAGIFYSSGVPSACTAVAEDARVSSEFYRYSVLGIIHDTLKFAERNSRIWDIPQVAYAARSASGSLTHGALHDAYVRCDAIAVPSLTPTRAQMDAMLYFEKFEHPIVPIDPPGRDPFESAASAVRDFVARTDKKIIPGSVSIEVFASLWELTEQSLSKIESAVTRRGNMSIQGVTFEHVADGLAFAVFSISILI